MKRMLILFVLAGFTLVASARSPETRSQCLNRCVSEWTARDLKCPPGGQYTDVARQQCLDASRRDYESCRSSCPKDPPPSARPPSPRPSPK